MAEDAESGLGTGMIVGILVVLVVGLLLFMYLGGGFAGRQQTSPGMDAQIDVNLPEGAGNGGAPDGGAAQERN